MNTRVGVEKGTGSMILQKKSWKDLDYSKERWLNIIQGYGLAAVIIFLIDLLLITYYIHYKDISTSAPYDIGIDYNIMFVWSVILTLIFGTGLSLLFVIVLKKRLYESKLFYRDHNSAAKYSSIRKRFIDVLLGLGYSFNVTKKDLIGGHWQLNFDITDIRVKIRVTGVNGKREDNLFVTIHYEDEQSERTVQVLKEKIEASLDKYFNGKPFTNTN